MSQASPTMQSSFAALRQFVRKRPRAERCELCGAGLATDHQHLIEPASRKLLCSCEACAILFSGSSDTRFRRVPRRLEPLPDFLITDAQWEGLCLPINLVFFFFSTPAQRVVAFYPSPAGATESLLTLESWQELKEVNPILDELEPDVEALLVNRIGQTRDYFRVPIDQCYKLVGLIRTRWRGLSGGAEVWEAIALFFAELNGRSC